MTEEISRVVEVYICLLSASDARFRCVLLRYDRTFNGVGHERLLLALHLDHGVRL